MSPANRHAARVARASAASLWRQDPATPCIALVDGMSSARARISPHFVFDRLGEGVSVTCGTMPGRCLQACLRTCLCPDMSRRVYVYV